MKRRIENIFLVTVSLVNVAISYAQDDSQAKMALVIGVKNYQYVAPLYNTLNDAMDMSATLKSKGFQVIELYDPKTKRDMQDGIVKYFQLLQSKKNTAGLVFYSGHGMQVDGTNYLIPSQANPQIKADLDDQCLNMDYVMRAIEQAGNPLNIFILDACRNNPFRGFYRSGEQGLNMVSTPKGSYIVYSTKPGSVASDGTGRNGLFTSKLLKHMSTSGISIEQVFKRVAADVSSESADAQRPWIASDYTGDFYFTPGDGSNNQSYVPSPSPATNTPNSESKSSTIDFHTEASIPKSVIIAGSEWFTKNLDVDHFANGDPIPQAKSEDAWKEANKTNQPAWCMVSNDFGKLYNYQAISDTRKLCPTGWHVSTDVEWKNLARFLGVTGGARLRSTTGWGTTGNDEYGFSALPGGFRSKLGVYFGSNLGAWWSDNKKSKVLVNFLISREREFIGENYPNKGDGYSVRCVKD